MKGKMREEFKRILIGQSSEWSFRSEKLPQTCIGSQVNAYMPLILFKRLGIGCQSRDATLLAIYLAPG